MPQSKDSLMLEIEEHSTTKLKHPELLKMSKNRIILKRHKVIQAECDSGKDQYIHSCLHFFDFGFCITFFDLGSISQDGFLEESCMRARCEDHWIVKFIKCSIFIAKTGPYKLPRSKEKI